MGLPEKFLSTRLTLDSLGTDIPAALAALEGVICDVEGLTIDVNVTATAFGLTNAGLISKALVEQKAAAPVGYRMRDATGGAEFRLANDGTYVSIDKNAGTEGTPSWTNLWKMAIATGVITNSAFPLTPSGPPVNNYDVANKKYVDDNCVFLAGDQSVAGIKTFASFPVTPSSAPSTNYQVANKKFVDDSIAGIVIPTVPTIKWAIADDAGNILRGSGISSFTKNATGNFTANFTVPFSDAYYAVGGSVKVAINTGQEGLRGICIRAITNAQLAGSVNFLVSDDAGTTTCHYFSIICVG